MKARIVRIGNSHGIRIPKPLLEQSGLRDEVELDVHAGQITIRAATQPRAGWDAAFRAMAEAGDDVLLDPEMAASPEWDEEEWEW
ncbi:MAG: Prevent host death protein, Phd antitoxin [uncultured Gemmatimonadetes bacterium]|uniref:Prevent host death protein, Phd antitoxin n=1 Tax=uncultured Gemmatimonadota bacterium TaxID=203437 RepID=A0A6J4N9W1_9BACT|nr:MAG: Prevent host death protein, Phd antitoxin [uncultured Gemmatimonadota bacterium]